jgi:hypothetical protein
MLQRAAGRKKCSSAEQIVRKSVGSGIFSLLILPDQKFEVDGKQSLLTQQELFTFPIGATQQSGGITPRIGRIGSIFSTRGTHRSFIFVPTSVMRLVNLEIHVRRRLRSEVHLTAVAESLIVAPRIQAQSAR